METVVSLVDVSMKYQTLAGEIIAVDKINLDIKRGEFLSIVGPSGCGKSTLLSIMAGLIKTSGGVVSVLGQPPRRGNTAVGYMLQKDHLFEWRNIYENVCLGLRIQKCKEEAAYKNVENLLKTYDLWEFRHAYPKELSGGMRQRVALIRTLATSPEILLLDEAFSALDYQTRLVVTDDIARIIENEKKTAVLVTHDISESISMSDRIAVLSKRPSVLKAVHEIEMPRGNPSLRRDDPMFRTYFNLIRKELNL